MQGHKTSILPKECAHCRHRRPSAPVTLTKPFFNMATFALLRICKGGRGAAHINNGLEFSIHIEKINDKTGTQKIPSPAILGMLWVF